VYNLVDNGFLLHNRDCGRRDEEEGEERSDSVLTEEACDACGTSKQTNGMGSGHERRWS